MNPNLVHVPGEHDLDLGGRIQHGLDVAMDVGCHVVRERMRVFPVEPCDRLFVPAWRGALTIDFRKARESERM
jgi:hypothetical protein